MALAAPASEVYDLGPVIGVADELSANLTRLVVLSDSDDLLRRVVGGRAVVAGSIDRVEGRVWRTLASSPRAGVRLDGGASFAPACRGLASRLGFFKLAWIDRAGGLTHDDGRPDSFVHLDELSAALRHGAPPERIELLREIEALLRGGVPAVNLCAADGLADELFTYAGSGTLFTRERYVVVRALGIDDYDAAQDLITRGVEEGYLLARSEEEIDRVLPNGFGVFIEGRYLAGIGALLVSGATRTGEISCLYTLTRFLGEGVGAHLVRFALERARELDLHWVFACTISERVGGFFQSLGFSRVEPEAVPESKWEGYDSERRNRLQCYRLDPGRVKQGSRATPAVIG